MIIAFVGGSIALFYSTFRVVGVAHCSDPRIARTDTVPDQPLEYRWCVKGRTKCGSITPTIEDFQRSIVEDSDTTPSSEENRPLQDKSKNVPMEIFHQDMSIDIFRKNSSGNVQTKSDSAMEANENCRGNSLNLILDIA